MSHSARARLSGALFAIGLGLAAGGGCVAAADESADESPAPLEETPPADDSLAARLGRELASDFRWSANNLEADAEDIVTSPCHAGDLLTNPNFYWTTLAVGASLGGSYALDESARSHFRKISPSDASHLQSWGTSALWGGTALLYGYGLAIDEPRARRYALTGMLSTGVSQLLTSALKTSFGRLRPVQEQGHAKWFQGGSSFVSSATTPAFALAATLSEYADNRWYVALPAYGAATAVGLGRMGKDAHWLSDIAGSALLGVGTTELFLHMHALHDANPSRYRVFPVVVQHTLGVGVSVEF